MRILGSGRYLPHAPVSNAELPSSYGADDLWIQERTGIRARHFARDVNVAEMATEAANRALEAARLPAASLDAIVVATISADMVFPSTAALLQSRLGARPIPAFDISAACTGFLYALRIVDGLMGCGAVKHALVVGAEKMSRLVDTADRSTAVIFGDGAGAVIVTRAEAYPGEILLFSDGSVTDLLYCAPALGRPFIHMNGPAVYRMAVRAMSDASKQALQNSGLEPRDVDWFVPHQANRRIIEAVAAHIGVPIERVIQTIQDHANVSAASIPIALDVGARDGRIRAGDKILVAAAGGGFTWSAGIIRWSELS